MTPDQFLVFIKSNEEATGRAIEKHVNGHIRDMSAKLDKHAAQDLVYQEKIDGNIAWVVKLIIGAVILGGITTLFK